MVKVLAKMIVIRTFGIKSRRSSNINPMAIDAKPSNHHLIPL